MSDEQSVEVDAQREEWERHVREEHAKGRCEFSGMTAGACVRSICDCFETEENADAMMRGNCRCSICRPPTEDKRPCRGVNSNVCVAEGCYGEACIR